MKTTNNYLIYIQDALEAFGLSDKTRKYGGDHSGYDTRMLYEIQDTIESLPPAQPTEASCWGCNCQKMERLKEQKTFSEMVRLHDAERREE